MIAKQEGAEILLLHVFESYMQNTMLQMRIDFTEVVERGIEDKFNEVKAANRNLANIPIHSKVTLGKIYSEIDRIALEEDVKLIVMGTHGRRGVNRASDPTASARLTTRPTANASVASRAKSR
jgi:nucleotide-binding universal stress UspA family protein